MIEGPKSKTTDEIQKPTQSDQNSNDPLNTEADSEVTGTDISASNEAEPEKFVDQMSHADDPSNDTRTDDSRV